MDGLTLIREATAAGLSVAVAGDRLVIRGPWQAEPVARKLIAHKPAVLAVLAVQSDLGAAAELHDDLPPDEAEAADLRCAYEERVGIRLFDAGYSRRESEHLAYGEMIEQWCEQHPYRHPSDRCGGCCAPLGNGALRLSDGVCVHWDKDPDFKCLIAYGLRRKRRAVEALALCGLQPPVGWAI